MCRSTWTYAVALSLAACGGKVVVNDAADGGESVAEAGAGGAPTIDASVDSDTAWKGPSGKLTHWKESGEYVSVEDEQVVMGFGYSGTSVVGFWSVAQADAGEGYFYGETSDTRVAVAEGISDVSQIHDAANFDYVDWSTHVVRKGEIVLLRHVSTGVVLALRVDDIYPGEKDWNDPPNTPGAYAYADVTWYLQTDGSGNFSKAW